MLVAMATILVSGWTLTEFLGGIYRNSVQEGARVDIDLLASRLYGIDYIIAPMVETPYALSKFVEAKDKVYGPADHSTEFLFNLETETTLRNLDRPAEALSLLRDFLADEPSHPLADAARAFAALALFDDGMPADALREALGALAPHLPRYGRAVTAYAAALDDD